MAVPGHRDDDDVARRGGALVVRPVTCPPVASARSAAISLGALGAAAADHHRQAGRGEPAGEAPALRSGAAEDGDGRARAVSRGAPWPSVAHTLTGPAADGWPATLQERHRPPPSPSPAPPASSAGGSPGSWPPPASPSACSPAPPTGCRGSTARRRSRSTGTATGPAVAKALRGVETLFMVSASEAPTGSTSTAPSSTRRPRRASGTSSTPRSSGPPPTATFTLGRDHFATEEHIKATGMAFTFLRDNFYLDFLPEMVGEDGVIRGPAGDGRRRRGRTRRRRRGRPPRCCPIPVRTSARRTTSPARSRCPSRSRRDPLDAPGARGQLPRRDRRGGLRVTSRVGRPALAVRRLGEHLHRDRQRRVRRRQRRRACRDRPAAEDPGRAPRRLAVR